MDALLMCGGRGARLDADAEKPLFEVAGRPMLDRVLAALAASRIETVYAVVSPAAPATRERCRERAGGDPADAGSERDVELVSIETPGDGYVPDLRTALADDRIAPPVLTVAADLPLLDADAVDAVLEAYSDRASGGDRSPTPSMTVCVPAALKDRLGVSVDAAVAPEHGHAVDCDLAPTGINVVADADAGSTVTHLTYDARLAVNVNRRSDAAVAADLCCDRSTPDSP